MLAGFGVHGLLLSGACYGMREWDEIIVGYRVQDSGFQGSGVWGGM